MFRYLNLRRNLMRVMLLLAFFAALAASAAAFFFHGTGTETWSTVAASLAVITSVFAAWSSVRVIEFQEDSQRPSPCPTFDFTSRYGMAQLRIKNTGGSGAHHIALEWNPDLVNDKNEVIGFTEARNANITLLPGESISEFMGPTFKFMEKFPETEFSGTVSFQDGLGRCYEQPFRLDVRAYKGTPLYDDEAAKTQYELQKIPEEIKALRKVLERSTAAAERDGRRGAAASAVSD